MMTRRLVPRLLSGLCTVVVVALLLTTLPVRAQSATAEALIAVVAASEPFADWLAQHPAYEADAAGPDENSLWYVEFHTAGREEWLGYAKINADTLEIVESFVPAPLPADVYQAQLARLMLFVLNDAEVLAWLNNSPDLWGHYPDWNRWEQQWEVRFYRGITGVVVSATVSEDGVYIARIADPDALDEEKARIHARDQAINLAYSAPGIDTALAGHAAWRTYVEQQGEQVWGVSFVDGGTRLIFVLVDVARQKVLRVE